MMRTAGSRCALILAALLFCTPVLAHDWTGQNDPQLAEWFSTLRRKIDNMSCCGSGDGYPVRILIEADPRSPWEDTGTAEILDGKELNLMNGMIHRVYLPKGTLVKFHYNHITSERQGNPTPYAWAFLSVWDGHGGPNTINRVFCIVPLPPGM